MSLALEKWKKWLVHAGVFWGWIRKISPCRRQPSLHSRITTVFLASFIVFVIVAGTTLLLVFNYQVHRYTEFVGHQYAVQLASFLEVYYDDKNSWEGIDKWLHKNFNSEKALNHVQIDGARPPQDSKLASGSQDWKNVQLRPSPSSRIPKSRRGRRPQRQPGMADPSFAANGEKGSPRYPGSSLEDLFLSDLTGIPGILLDNEDLESLILLNNLPPLLFWQSFGKNIERRNAISTRSSGDLQDTIGFPDFYSAADLADGSAAQELGSSGTSLESQDPISMLLSSCLVDPFCSYGLNILSRADTEYFPDLYFDQWLQLVLPEGRIGASGGKVELNSLDGESLKKFLREEGFRSWVRSEGRPDLFAKEQLDSDSLFSRFQMRYINVPGRNAQMFVLLDPEHNIITSNLPEQELIQQLGRTWNKLQKYIADYQTIENGADSNSVTLINKSLGVRSQLVDNHNIFVINDKNNDPVGFLYAESIVSPIWKNLNYEVNAVIIQVLLFSSLVITLIYWLIGRFHLRRLFMPLRSLSVIAAEVRKGNTAARVQRIPKEAELALVTEQFNKMLDSLAHEVMLREQQSRDVAHELRTPITIISGELQLIQEGVYRADEEKIQGLSNQVQQIQRLVQDLEILYKVSQKDEESHQELIYLEPVSISQLLQETYFAFQTQMKQKKIDFTLKLGFSQASTYVLGDASRLHQVFGNFLVNAMRYTPAGGKIEIGGCYIRITKAGTKVQENGMLGVPEGHYVLLSVSDTGCGIPAEKRELVFERFFRVDNARGHQSGGSGLGLAISKSFIKLHNGKIWVEESGLQDPKGKGAKFCVMLPCVLSTPDIIT